MLSSLRQALLLVFLVLPLLEIAILIKVGQTIGFWPTMTLLVAAAAYGFVLIREAGLAMVGRMFAAVDEGRLPFESLLDSYAVIIAGMLLIVPGFVSDTAALVVLTPPLRRFAIRRLLPEALTAPRAAKRPTVIDATSQRTNEEGSRLRDET
jgi:UPF0716 protein FxsA